MDSFKSNAVNTSSFSPTAYQPSNSGDGSAFQRAVESYQPKPCKSASSVSKLADNRATATTKIGKEDDSENTNLQTEKPLVNIFSTVILPVKFWQDEKSSTEESSLTGIEVAVSALTDGVATTNQTSQTTDVADMAKRFADIVAKMSGADSGVPAAVTVSFSDASGLLAGALVERSADGSLALKLSAASHQILVQSQLDDLRRRLTARGMTVRSISVAATDGSIIDITAVNGQENA